MRILYVSRLFSGLETSVASGLWAPTGVPTIYRVIEALAEAGHDVRVMLAMKPGTSLPPRRGRETVRLQGLDIPVTVLGDAGPLRLPRPLRSAVRELRHLWAIHAAARRLRPDLVYIDHANVWAAGPMARWSGIPTVFRVMGVYPAMREALGGRRIAHRLLRWSYRSPFAAVICTQDGSGAELWLDRALAPAVPRRLLLNGADIVEPPDRLDPALAGVPADRVVVLFVGKLEAAKGIDAFADAFLAAREAAPGRLHALIIGTGSRHADVAERFAQAGAQADATWIARLPNAQIHAAQQRADIYVSMNRLGNLSNANLEAIKAGACMIIPEAQPALAIDVATDRLLPPDTALRIPAGDDGTALARAILRLLAAPQERAARAARTAEVGRTLPAWSQRVAQEIALLEALAAQDRGAADPVSAPGH